MGSIYRHITSPTFDWFRRRGIWTLWVLLAFVPLNLPNTGFGLNNPPGTSDPSSADLDVTLTVPTMFRISGIADLSFGSYSGNGNLALDDDVCVWTNAAGGNYQVTAQGSGASFAFTVVKTGDASKTIPYAVKWNNTSGTIGNVALTANVASGNMSGANNESISCSSGPSDTANFQASFTQADLLATVAGVYTGVLSLIISAPI